jgi:serine protease Do
MMISMRIAFDDLPRRWILSGAALLIAMASGTEPASAQKSVNFPPGEASPTVLKPPVSSAIVDVDRRDLPHSAPAPLSFDSRDDNFPVDGAGQTKSIDQRYDDLAAEVAMLDRMSNVVRAVSSLVRPCVVHIEANKVEQSRGRTESFEEAGSGVIISHRNQPWVLTNRHVINGSIAAEITLRLSDGRRITPSRILSDPLTDVAILQIDETDVLTARLGNSDQMRIGDFVIAIGSPFGLSHSVTFGIVSALGRRDLTLGEERIELQDFIQTDAAINPGNSGGPLVNLRGEVVGLNTAIASSSGGGVGIGFAIPMNMVDRVVDQLIRFGHLRRGYLGVSLDPEFDTTSAVRMGLPAGSGALVKTVREGSPAMKAGIAVGDIITQFDNHAIENDDHLVTCVGLTAAGEDATVVIYRNGKAYKTVVRITDIPR